MKLLLLTISLFVTQQIFSQNVYLVTKSMYVEYNAATDKLSEPIVTSPVNMKILISDNVIIINNKLQSNFRIKKDTENIQKDDNGRISVSWEATDKDDKICLVLMAEVSDTMRCLAIAYLTDSMGSFNTFSYFYNK